MSAAPPPPETPKLYLTPQLQKRRDGLAPALLDPQKEVILEDKTSLTRSYRTSSHFLRVSVLKGDGDDGCGVDDSKELQTIVDSIQHTVKTLDKKDVSRVQFYPQGCLWQLSLPVPQYHIRVGCSACSEEGGSGGNTYVVETTLVPPNNGGGGNNNNHQHEPAFKDAKAIFDSVVLYVRKAAVSCEFPEFPEGCKGTAFRDIYQLNARVSRTLFILPKQKWLHVLLTRTLVLSLSRAAQVGFFCHSVSRYASCVWQKGGHQVCAEEGFASLGRRGHLRRSSDSSLAGPSLHCTPH